MAIKYTTVNGCEVCHKTVSNNNQPDICDKCLEKQSVKYYGILSSYLKSQNISIPDSAEATINELNLSIQRATYRSKIGTLYLFGLFPIYTGFYAPAFENIKEVESSITWWLKPFVSIHWVNEFAGVEPTSPWPDKNISDNSDFPQDPLQFSLPNIEHIQKANQPN